MKKIFTLFAALAMVMSMSAAPYLKGSFNDWGGGNPLSSGSTTITLGANAIYEFKVNDGNTWYGNSGTMTSTNCTDWAMSSSAGNCKIKTTIAGVYTFKWNASSKKLSVVYPTEAVVIDYYIAGSKGLCGDEWKVDGIKMVNNDGVYTHTFTKVPAGTYEFKVTQGDWNKTAYGYGALATSYKNVADKDGNIQVTFAETQDLTVTFQGSTISLNLPEKTNTVYFVNEKSWTKVNAYVWDVDAYKTWPGEEMTKVEGKTFNGKDVYTYTFPAKNTNIIFSQNGADDKKTGDLKYNESKIYYYNNTWNATIEYDKPKYNVNVTAENGTVEGAGEYEEGKEATLTANAAEGYEFTCWTSGEDTVSTENPYKFTVTANVDLVANFKEAEPEYQVIEDEITNFVFDTEAWPMVCQGGPSATYQIEVFLVLTEDADGTLSYEDCSVSIMGTDATFIEGTLSDLDVYAPSADAVLRVQWNGEFYELHLAMSAAAEATEPTNVLVTNAVKSYDEGSGALKLTGLWEGAEVFVEIGGYEGKESIEYSTPQGVLFETPDVAAFGNEASIIVAGEDITVVCNGLKPMMGNDVYNVTITTLSEVSTALDNLNTTVAPVKMIENGQLIIVKDGVQYNAQGAILK
jgi:hypothetical protein